MSIKPVDACHYYFAQTKREKERRPVVFSDPDRKASEPRACTHARLETISLLDSPLPYANPKQHLIRLCEEGAAGAGWKQK